MSSNSGGGGAQALGVEIHRKGGQQQRNEPTNQRYSNLIYDSEVFLTKLREFKPQSLGCLEARRKSSSTLIFPNPQQACLGPPKCSRYPHNVKPTPGYWIECHGSGALAKTQAANEVKSPSEEQATAGCGSKAKLSRDLQFRRSSTKLDEIKLILDGPSVQSSSGVTFQKAIDLSFSARQVKDGAFNQGDLDDVMRHDLTKRRQSADLFEFSSDQQQARNAPSCGSGAGGRTSAKSGSSPEVTSNREGQSGGKQPDSSRGESESLSRNASELRKRLNKRTMTRDDIDLHKPRRSTPNITITEPSFNQPTFTYQPTSSHQRITGKQVEHTSESKIPSMNDTDSPIPGAANEPTAIKFQIQHFISNEAQYSIDDSTKDATEGLLIERQESLEGDESSSLSELNSKQLDFKPYRQQHRPSVIREDSDADGEGSREQKEFYCGLSTTTFKKKPCQQSYQQLPDTDQFRDGSLELISFEEENYEKHYYGREHWNYFTNDELLGPVMLSLKQEVNNQRDHFHVLLRTVSYTLHGTIPASTICADRYDREAIVKELSEIAKLKPPLMLGQLPSTPDELLKLDHIFIKTELKVGVIYIKAGQAESEEAILGNKEESPLFSEFLDLLGDRITLKGFDRYKGGLDTVHNLTGTESVYTMWRNIEIMFHVSTMLPHEENDPQKLQKKRHIGNDIVCVAFIESDDTLFWPGCIKSYFLHTFITIRTSPKPLKEGEKRKYHVSCVCRNEVQYAFKPYLVEQDEFFKSDYFREWLLVKIVNGERASYSAPKFARMQDRTRSQLLEDIITNLVNHLETGQIPKPYRRGSWRPLGHTRASSPLEDSMKDYFEDYDQLAKDFCNAFCGPSRSMLCDVVFKVKDKDGTYKLVHGVRAIMAIRSRTFLEMLYGFVPPGTGPSSLHNQTSLRAIEMKALSGESAVGVEGGRELDHAKSLLAKRGSVGTDSSKKIGNSNVILERKFSTYSSANLPEHFATKTNYAGEKERRQSMLPNLSKSITQKPNYLTVPSTAGGGVAGGSGGGGTGGMIKNAFNRLVSGNW